MIEIEEVSLDITWPDNEIRLVMMQPFIKLDMEKEPFAWLESEREKQFERIKTTLDIASNGAGGGAHFTLLPEYSIPDLRGVDIINEIVSRESWPQNSVLIGGVDGLNEQQYSQLCSNEHTNVSDGNKASNILAHQWINCAILWAKQSDGSITRWVQPKISPSWIEEAITARDMFQGRSVYVFTTKFANGTQCRFIYLICFDWIASDAGSSLLWEILQNVDSLSNPTKKDLNLFFILEHNPKPNHHAFLEHTRRYFEEQTNFPFTVRNESAVVFANTAGGERPGLYDAHGCSSMIFSPRAPYDCRACPPSAAVVTKKLRGTDSLGGCKDSLLREMGSCLHAVRVTLPQFINLGSGERSLPLRSVEVFALERDLEDARTPGQPVPAIVKWVNDHLDAIPMLLAEESTHPLKTAVQDSHLALSTSLRRGSEDELLHCIGLAGVSKQGTPKEKWLKISGLRDIQLVDNWDGAEVARLKVIIQTLSVLGAFVDLHVSCSPGHAVIQTSSQVYDVIVISGGSHKECFEHALNNLISSAQRITIVISQDIGDTILPDRDRSITVAEPTDQGRGPNITDPYASCKHLGHQNLMSACVGAAGLSEFGDRMRAILKL